MPKVTFKLDDGSSQTVDGAVGESVMQLATENGIEGIIGRCGGYCNCGTCHVYVDEKWLSALPEPSPEEDMMLDGTPAERLPNSRLSCQIVLTKELDTVVVTLPECQE